MNMQKVEENESKSVENEKQEEKQSEFTEIEQKALEQGWDPNGKKNAEWFLEFGELKDALKSQQRKLRTQEQEFNSRLEAVNKMHKAQMGITIADLTRKRDAAVEEGDVTKVKQYQDDIDAAKNQQVSSVAPAAVDPDQSVYQEWIDKNSWFTENSKKAKYALACNNEYLASNPNASPQQVIAYVEKEVNEMFPKVNSRREQPSTTETSTRRNTSNSRELTMNDLTVEERLFWRQGGSTLYPSEKEFLKVVKDSRG